jgi:hypothetical protein
MKNKFSINRLTLAFASLLLAAGLSSCKEPKYEQRDVCHVLIRKHTAIESLNRYGAIEEVYYFLYDNNDLEKVSLKTYMKFEQGQTLCWQEHYRVQ